MTETALQPEQFVLLVARHERRLRGFIATLVPFDSEAIDELLQSTYLVAWRKLDDFRYQDEEPDEEAIRWITAIARFEALSYLRQLEKNRRLVFSEALVNEIADVQVQEADYFEARRGALSRCVEKLDDSQRESVRLRYGIGLSMSELAARQGKRANTVAAALARIRKALEHCIRQTLRQEGFSP